jgi:hypothetical protein
LTALLLTALLLTTLCLTAPVAGVCDADRSSVRSVVHRSVVRLWRLCGGGAQDGAA